MTCNYLFYLLIDLKHVAKSANVINDGIKLIYLLMSKLLFENYAKKVKKFIAMRFNEQIIYEQIMVWPLRREQSFLTYYLG